MKNEKKRLGPPRPGGAPRFPTSRLQSSVGGAPTASTSPADEVFFCSRHMVTPRRACRLLVCPVSRMEHLRRGCAGQRLGVDEERDRLRGRHGARSPASPPSTTDRPTDRPTGTRVTMPPTFFCPRGCYRLAQRARRRYTCADAVEFLCGPIPAYTAFSCCANLIFPSGLA
jgi:hypothetical protein